MYRTGEWQNSKFRQEGYILKSFNKQEDYFVDLTARARELKPDSKSRILNYFATNGQGFQCYHAYDELKARPDLMLKVS